MVTISTSEQTMIRRGFVAYGPSGAAVETLAWVMAADLAQTRVRANIPLSCLVGARAPGIPTWAAGLASLTRILIVLLRGA